jgi:hypothetical protein
MLIPSIRGVARTRAGVCCAHVPSLSDAPGCVVRKSKWLSGDRG